MKMYFLDPKTSYSKRPKLVTKTTYFRHRNTIFDKRKRLKQKQPKRLISKMKTSETDQRKHHISKVKLSFFKLQNVWYRNVQNWWQKLLISDTKTPYLRTENVQNKNNQNVLFHKWKRLKRINENTIFRKWNVFFQTPKRLIQKRLNRMTKTTYFRHQNTIFENWKRPKQKQPKRLIS